MSFRDEEVGYLRSQRLARISTVSADGQPDVLPVGFEFDGTYLYVGGIAPLTTRKFKDVEAGNTKVELVVDDLPSVNPWTPRYLRVYGTAELVEREGHFGKASNMRITPRVSWSFNLEGTPFSHAREIKIHRTAHEAPAAQQQEA